MKFKSMHKTRLTLVAFLLISVFINVTFVATVAAESKSSISRYVVGPEDVLEISVWKEEDLQKQVLVRPDGKISFPLIGEINALNKSPENIKNEITIKLAKFIPDPVVTVILTKVAAYRIYIIGQVKKPGQFVIGRFVNVLQALALAGGLTPFAAEDKIRIIRNNNGQDIQIPFEYGAIKNGKGLKQNIMLKAGDILLIP